jgi:ParB family chromosome partitioning protein
LIDEPKGILRMDIDLLQLQELAQSISEVGLLQPIMVAVDGDRYEVVFGHRRYLASKELGLTKIRCIVKTMTQAEIGLARATENISRADLTPLEEASTYKNLIEDYGLTIEQVAKKMAKSPGTIKRRMDLLRMPPPLQQAIHKKQISMSVAEELWPISDPADLDYYLSFALEGGCTTEVARSWCKDWRDAKRRKANNNEPTPSQLAPNEPRPIYVTCDLCTGPMELGKETVLRLCPECSKTIKQNI